MIEESEGKRDAMEKPKTIVPIDGSPIVRGVKEKWKKLAGEDNWLGLLDPMDPLLRSELIRYGEMAQACYDAFEDDPFSVNYGSCKYDRQLLFQSLGKPNCGYNITRYLYATSNTRLPNFLRRSQSTRNLWSELANWIGFVAVSDDVTTYHLGRRDIAVAWRGTVTRLEWLADLSDILRPVASEGIPSPSLSVKVESGFLDLYTDKNPNCRYSRYSAREQVLGEVCRLVDLYGEKGEEISITITGHSLGSALAMLSAYDIAATGANVTGKKSTAAPLCVYSFSGPRVGNDQFKERFERVLKVRALRVVNVHDLVPRVPGVLANEGTLKGFAMAVAKMLLPWWCYMHVGVELLLDHRVSTFLKETTDAVCSHNLEVLLHIVAGYRGKKEEFVLDSGRDPALVNKSCDFLKEDHQVPPCWMQEKNRGMVMKDGMWVLQKRRRVDPEHDILHHLRRIGIDVISIPTNSPISKPRSRTFLLGGFVGVIASVALTALGAISFRNRRDKHR